METPREPPRLTPVQQRMLDVLSDGLLHRAEELHACLVDDMGALRNIASHLSLIRQALKPQGETVSLVRIDGVPYWHLVRFVQGGGVR